MIVCNPEKKIMPSLPLTEIQRSVCLLCRHASKKRIWCCKFGFYIRVVISKLIPPTAKKKPCYGRKTRLKLVNDVGCKVVKERMSICQKCDKTYQKANQLYCGLNVRRTLGALWADPGACITNFVGNKNKSCPLGKW